MNPTTRCLFASSLVGLLFICAFQAALPQESQTYVQTVLADKALLPAERKQDYLGYNFAPLWLQTHHSAVFGIIGARYQRLHMKLLTATKDPTAPGRYRIAGKSKVNNTVCSFSGTLTIRNVREWKVKSTRCDETVSPARKEGILLADYRLAEDSTQHEAGVFTGVVQTNWYVDKKGRLLYDDIVDFGDGFCNNQFVGIWTSYRNNKTLRCNWGDHRVPNAGAFDLGAGEFSPDPKYAANGWQQYISAWTSDPQSKAAQQREEKPWW